MNNRERGWPEDCRKCDLYDQEKARLQYAVDQGCCADLRVHDPQAVQLFDEGGLTVDYNKLVEQLKGMLPKKVRYGELVGAPVPYNQMGDMVYEDPEPYIIEQAADAITELVARAEKAEQERDGAISEIEHLVSVLDCPTEVCKEICANHDGICAEHAEHGLYDRCEGFKWLRQEE